jgi:hypothetical protein
MASLSAVMILAMRAWSIEHGAKTDSDLARPSGGDHPATQQASQGVQCGFPDDSGIEEERAGGGPGPPGGGPDQEDRAWRADVVYQEYWRSTH